MAVLETIQLVVAPPHKAGYPFILGSIGLWLLGMIVGWGLGWVGFLALAFCLYFFRDPERVPPGRTGLVLAPADGTVVSIQTAIPPFELGLGETPRWRVAIFLSAIDVHVNRIPVDGTVTKIAYRHGAFINASLDKASEDNERNALAIKLADGRDLVVVQIAGLIARRILCHAKEGDVVRAGERFGIIRFGSRTDLYLPEGVQPLVAIGQTMVGGETVIAELAHAGS